MIRKIPYQRGILPLLLCVLAGCATVSPPTPPTPPTARSAAPEPICFDCFWRHHDPAFRAELVAFYQSYETDDPVVRADVHLLVSRVRGDLDGTCCAFDEFATIRDTTQDRDRRLRRRTTGTPDRSRYRSPGQS